MNTVMCVWPSIYKDEDIEFLEQYLKKRYIIKGKIKISNLKYEVFKEFVLEVYKNELWIQNNNYADLEHKARCCFGNGDLICFLLEIEDLDKLIRDKEVIREILQKGKHSVHSTDGCEEYNFFLKSMKRVFKLKI